MTGRFWVLRVISELLKLTALVSLILGTLGALTAFSGQLAASVTVGVQPLGVSQVPDILLEIAGVASFTIGFVVFLVLYGTSQLFYVLIAIEENTRRLHTSGTALEDSNGLAEAAELAS